MQSLANTAWAFATVGHEYKALFPALARAAQPRPGECNAQELANTAWAFATVGQVDDALFAALARAAESRLGSFNAQDLANSVWAFATAGQEYAVLFASKSKHSIPSQSKMLGMEGRVFIACTVACVIPKF